MGKLLVRLRNLYQEFDNTDVARVPRNVGKQGNSRRLTSGDCSVTINPNRGDKETRPEFQPHLNEGLWAVYLEEFSMRDEPPPTDGREEAPGARPPN